MDLPRIGRKYAKITATATDADGDSIVLTAVHVALLEPETKPDADTTWIATELVSGKFRVLFAGPYAAGDGAIVVLDDSDLWARVTDSPEVDAVWVDRINLT